MRRKAPRAGINSNRGFVELGSFRRKNLRRQPVIEFFKWNSISEQNAPEARAKPRKPEPDKMRLAKHYQALMDSGKFESRAVLARHLGVSRARVTQVLNRLREAAPD